MDKSTQNQVQKIKELSVLQAEITSLQLDMKLWETHFQLHKLSGLTGDVLEDNRSICDNLYKDNLEKMTEEDKKHYYEQQYYVDQLNNLRGHIKRFEIIKEQLGIINYKLKLPMAKDDY